MALFLPLLIIVLCCKDCHGAENNPYLVKHDTTTHVISGFIVGNVTAQCLEYTGAPRWVCAASAFVAPALLGQIKERCLDEHYSGKDANAWCIGGIAATASYTFIW